MEIRVKRITVLNKNYENSLRTLDEDAVIHTYQ